MTSMAAPKQALLSKAIASRLPATRFLATNPLAKRCKFTAALTLCVKFGRLGEGMVSSTPSPRRHFSKRETPYAWTKKTHTRKGRSESKPRLALLTSARGVPPASAVLLHSWIQSLLLWPQPKALPEVGCSVPGDSKASRGNKKNDIEAEFFGGLIACDRQKEHVVFTVVSFGKFARSAEPGLLRLL